MTSIITISALSKAGQELVWFLIRGYLAGEGDLKSKLAFIGIRLGIIRFGGQPPIDGPQDPLSKADMQVLEKMHWNIHALGRGNNGHES